MNLLVEIGNTVLKAAWAEGMTLGKTFRYQGEDIVGFILSLTKEERPDTIVVSSSERLGESDRGRIAARCGRLVVLDNGGASIAAAYGLPEHLPSDRVAAIVAARHLFKGKGSIVFDFGTTISIDIIEPDGEYVGGNISPGLMSRFLALRRYSKNLPLVSIPATVRQTGDSIVSSIESGVVSGIEFEIQGYLNLFPEKIIVFTGGDALYFAKRMKNSIFAVYNLVLMGLAFIAGDYVEKNCP